MATIINVGPNQQTIQWSITQAAPNGDFVDVAGWLIASVDWEGTPGGSSPAFTLNGANGASVPSAGGGTAIAAYNASAAGLIAGSPNACRWIAPTLATGGDGTTAMTCTVLLVR